MTARGIKCVIIGDGAVGKTCLIYSFIKGSLPGDYVPTIFDNYSKLINIQPENIIVNIGLWDTAGQEDYEKLRPLSYKNTDVLIICYSCISPASLQNIKSKWIPEIKKYCQRVPFVIAGTKSDLVDDPTILEKLQEYALEPITTEFGQKFAFDVEAYHHTQCSAVKNENVSVLFEYAIRAVLSGERKTEKIETGCVII